MICGKSSSSIKGLEFEFGTLRKKTCECYLACAWKICFQYWLIIYILQLGFKNLGGDDFDEGAWHKFQSQNEAGKSKLRFLKGHFRRCS